jgi:hypothetical protein
MGAESRDMVLVLLRVIEMSGISSPFAMKQRIIELEDALRQMIDTFDLPDAVKNKPSGMRHGVWNKNARVLERAKSVLGTKVKSNFDFRSAESIMDSDRQAEIAVKG